MAQGKSAIVVDSQGHFASGRIEHDAGMTPVRLQVYMSAELAAHTRKVLRATFLPACASFSQFVETAVIHELERQETANGAA